MREYVDVLGPGETFGRSSVLPGLAPALSVRAFEDTLCYRFPAGGRSRLDWAVANLPT